MNDLEMKICFICGKGGADSKDHIPPKNIFLPENRNKGHDLITVPAHIKCNKSFEKDDENFQFFLTIPGFWNDQKARDLWEKKVFKGLSRPETTGYREYINSLMEPIQIVNEKREIIADTALVKIDSDRVNRVLERIARGLYYYENQTILPLDHIIEPMFLKPEFHSMRYEIVKTNEHKSFGANTFQYWWNYATDQKDTCVFWFRFFYNVNMVVFCFNKESYEKRHA